MGFAGLYNTSLRVDVFCGLRPGEDHDFGFAAHNAEPQTLGPSSRATAGTSLGGDLLICKGSASRP